MKRKAQRRSCSSSSFGPSSSNIKANKSRTKAEHEPEPRGLLGSFSRISAIVEPHIDARRFPVVGLVQNVQIPIAIQIGQARLVKTVADDELSLFEIPFSVAVE